MGHCWGLNSNSPVFGSVQPCRASDTLTAVAPCPGPAPCVACDLVCTCLPPAPPPPVLLTSEGGADPMGSTLQLRQAVRACIMQGHVPDAMQQLQQHCPLVLSGHTCSAEVQFHLRCQQYIELIR